MEAVIEVISNGLKLFASWFTYADHRSQLKNSPEMQQAAAAKQLQEQEDQITKNVADGNIDKIRQDEASK